MNNLRSVDLNLLVTLQALLVEKHITRAASRLHKSQPAVSHALAHLRRLFDDPLLIRRGGQLELTARASELLHPLNDALGQIGTLFEPPQFDPTKARRVFRLAMSDYGSRVLLPGLIRAFRAMAPGVELLVSQASRESMLADVREGEVDLALGVFPGKQLDELKRHTLFSERFVCVADASSIPEKGIADLEGWLKRPHVLVAMRAGADNEVDRALGKLGVQRQISVSLPHWSVASDLIAGTDLILTVARRSLDAVDSDERLRLFEPPFEIPRFDFNMIWHPRRESDPAHAWLRQMIMRVANEQ
ncbi:LysR family transcriptional regulator [Pseudomonas sp. S75]|uniref:LysR family transcriptional regulator n=1 Tax=unclassified Pseudomonas TaxID=196821 RepID=UPI0019042C2B|nr:MULTISPECIES: LysR family transcriptional regulator [unclassified Pseudomonas]MBJ9977092.1 LysR family transcriptional regulator [Pseudomonas sp. S30]MBK0154094.1 LysR family transcriptional regulator [Pseudomonas sp. S75]